MKKCSFEKYLMPFLEHELSEHNYEKTKRHLLECDSCSDAVHDVEEMQQLLQTYERQPAPKAVLAAYNRDIKKMFQPVPFWRRYGSVVLAHLTKLVQSQTVGYRVARSFAVLLLGVFIGRAVFVQPQPRPVIVEKDQAAAPAIQLTAMDVQQLTDYFVQSELLLLSIANSSAKESVSNDDLMFNKEIAQSLLVKTSAIQRKAGAIDDESIIVFLNHLEFVLLEISNREDDEVHSAFQEIRDMVNEADLLQKSRRLQEKMTRSLLPSA